MKAMIMGKRDIKIMPRMTMVKLFFTIGIFPKKNPARLKDTTQITFPTMLKEMNRK
jgi:hypothetical protein